MLRNFSISSSSCASTASNELNCSADAPASFKAFSNAFTCSLGDLSFKLSINSGSILANPCNASAASCSVFVSSCHASSVLSRFLTISFCHSANWSWLLKVFFISAIFCNWSLTPFNCASTSPILPNFTCISYSLAKLSSLRVKSSICFVTFSASESLRTPHNLLSSCQQYLTPLVSSSIAQVIPSNANEIAARIIVVFISPFMATVTTLILLAINCAPLPIAVRSTPAFFAPFETAEACCAKF